MLVFYIASGLFLSVIAQHFEYPELVPGRWEQFLFYAIFTLVSVVIYKISLSFTWINSRILYRNFRIFILFC
jgi:hypothetical protein